MSKKYKGDLALEAASAAGALIGLGLNFTVLSPLVIGGIVSFSSITMFLVLVSCLLEDVLKRNEKINILKQM
ncbi:hypothetical protein IC220_00340 [Wolbachia endosymbiont of Pentalonia nigronervosa]|jgi:hypothetical protein|uniref:hypothetical protein n=1 Tax=Wolbachia endosymbiont of Pentalonia nigronervosa TaxID=1301914 RepID=UPI00165F8EEF|nr:hypothetical protein [Wolbachia endosymbiont of Pentalonia nigronervosa]MBD0390923.1 hypothetical protein [Wolbachia endosymbiont of Pentalonia nigronervosa]